MGTAAEKYGYKTYDVINGIAFFIITRNLSIML
jgi:hypothetical protein